MSLHLSKLHCSLKGKEMWNTSFLCFMNRNAETKKVIKLSQPTQEGRGRTKHAGSKQRHEESQQQLVRLPLWRVGPSLHLQCGDSHFLWTMFIYFIFFFSVNNFWHYVALTEASYAQQLCVLWKVMSIGNDAELSDSRCQRSVSSNECLYFWK